MLLQFTCSKTNGLPSVLGATVAAKHYLQSPSSPYLPSPYHSQLSSRLTSDVPGLSSSLSPYMSPRCKSLPPGIVTHSSSVFHRQYHRLWSKVDLGVSLLFSLCEGHLYQSPSCPPNYFGLQK